MCVEEDYTYDNGGTPGLDLTRYGVGARGIDLIERVVNGGSPSLVFPLYDGHGNMTATLSRSGASFTVSNQRSYDVWGGVRSGATSGFPNTRYVANLGHKQDDESDLIYMRARYYEPWTGRFISEDPARDGGDWFSYCASSPVAGIDPDGRFYIDIAGYWLRIDSAYSQEGTGRLVRDLTWGVWRRGTRVQMGSIRPDGSVKHGSGIPDALRKLIHKDQSLAKKLTRRGGYGIFGIHVLTTSLDAAFFSDPYAFGEVIDVIGGDLQILQGLITISDS